MHLKWWPLCLVLNVLMLALPSNCMPSHQAFLAFTDEIYSSVRKLTLCIIDGLFSKVTEHLLSLNTSHAKNEIKLSDDKIVLSHFHSLMLLHVQKWNNLYYKYNEPRNYWLSIDKNMPMVHFSTINMFFERKKFRPANHVIIYPCIWYKDTFLVHEALYKTSFTFACLSVHWSYGLVMSSCQSVMTMFTMGTSY